MAGGAAGPYRAVTFDFWNTVMYEPEGGLEGARVRLWCELLADLAVPRTHEQLENAHAVAVAEQQAAWRQNVQYVTRDATARMLTELALDLCPGDVDAFDAVFAEAGPRSGVECCTGIDEVARRLQADGVRLAIVCDIGLTPAEGVRALLRDADLLDVFDATVFSDETGVYKPDRRMFEAALTELEVPARGAVHVGDRRRTDVEGALDAGMHAVRYRAVFDDLDRSYRDGTYVLDRHDDLLDLCGVR